jgi:hypothetical protein
MSDRPVLHSLQPPPPDGRHSETASQVLRGTGRFLRNMGFAVLPEVTLASGRRADIMAIDAQGFIWIVEIKSSLADYRADGKWPEYRDFCDRFCFAIPADLDPAIIPAEVGLIVADAYGAEWLRQGPEHPLHASRRKSVSLLFARAAAQRLHSLWDP